MTASQAGIEGEVKARRPKFLRTQGGGQFGIEKNTRISGTTTSGY